MPQGGLKIIDGGQAANPNPTHQTKTEDVCNAGEFETSKEVSARIERNVTQIRKKTIESARQKESSFFDFELGLIPMVFSLGRLFILLFLTVRQEQMKHKLPNRMQVDGRWFTFHSVKKRWLGTFFGKVTYWRDYYAREGGGNGFHPLDKALGLTTDRFSLNVIGLVSRLATKMPFAIAGQVFACFLKWTPANKTIEEMVLGLGTHTQEYFDSLGPMPGDGDVLVIQIDGKAAPTATEAELKKRRGKRKPNPYPESARHRGREKRRQARPKKRRQKGEKSKNGRMATLVVMYTLKSTDDGILVGPNNKIVYASFAAKRHAFAWARNMAAKRGFAPGSGKLIQFVSDGDKDYRVYLDDLFSNYSKREFIELVFRCFSILSKLKKLGKMSIVVKF